MLPLISPLHATSCRSPSPIHLTPQNVFPNLLNSPCSPLQASKAELKHPGPHNEDWLCNTPVLITLSFITLAEIICSHKLTSEKKAKLLALPANGSRLSWWAWMKRSRPCWPWATGRRRKVLHCNTGVLSLWEPRTMHLNTFNCYANSEVQPTILRTWPKIKGSSLRPKGVNSSTMIWGQDLASSSLP